MLNLGEPNCHWKTAVVVQVLHPTYPKALIEQNGDESAEAKLINYAVQF